MTHQSAAQQAAPGADAGHRIAQLRHALILIEQIGGIPDTCPPEDALDEAARISSAYGDALPVLQRRFDALAAEVSAWAAAGTEALVKAGETAPPRAAALRLAGELRSALANLTGLLRL